MRSKTGILPGFWSLWSTKKDRIQINIQIFERYVSLQLSWFSRVTVAKCPRLVATSEETVCFVFLYRSGPCGAPDGGTGRVSVW